MRVWGCSPKTRAPTLQQRPPPCSAPHRPSAPRCCRLAPLPPQAVRDQFYIICEGANLPPPIPNFADMKFPPAVLKARREDERRRRRQRRSVLSHLLWRACVVCWAAVARCCGCCCTGCCSRSSLAVISTLALVHPAGARGKGHQAADAHPDAGDAGHPGGARHHRHRVHRLGCAPLLPALLPSVERLGLGWGCLPAVPRMPHAPHSAGTLTCRPLRSPLPLPSLSLLQARRSSSLCP